MQNVMGLACKQKLQCGLESSKDKLLEVLNIDKGEFPGLIVKTGLETLSKGRLELDADKSTFGEELLFLYDFGDGCTDCLVLHRCCAWHSSFQLCGSEQAGMEGKSVRRRILVRS